MTLLVRCGVLAFALLLASFPAFASSVSLVGSLDPQNPNDGLVVTFTLSTSSNLNVQSYGFGGSANAPGGTNANGAVISPGGFDTYFSLFAGGGNGATFLGSNDDGLCPPGDDTLACRDSTINLSLGAGTYTLAVTAFDNFSFAENLGAGSLGDGFIGLGNYFNLDCFCDRTSDYAIDLNADGLNIVDVHTLGSNAVPEPTSIVLLGSGILVGMKACRPKAL